MRPRRALAGMLLALLATPAAAQGNDPSFNLVNRSGQAIQQIHVSPVTERSWGRDWLGQDVLPPGRSFPIRIAPSAGCMQDVRVVYADGRAEERRSQNTCTMNEMVFGIAAPPQVQGATPGNPSFNLVNHGRQPMREVYVSSAREADWGRQRLPQPMQPGQHLRVQLALNDCINDVRVIWGDGRIEDRRQVDTCRLVNMVFQ
jgi:hypothetical protein